MTKLVNLEFAQKKAIEIIDLFPFKYSIDELKSVIYLFLIFK